MFDLFCRRSQKAQFFRILSPCPKCGSQIRRAYVELGGNSLWGIWSIGMSWDYMYPLNKLDKSYQERKAEELELEIKKNPTKPYIYDIECPNCGFLTKKGLTYIQIKSKEYK